MSFRATAAGGSGVTQFLHDGDALVGEYDAAGTLRHRYVHGADAAADDPLVWYDVAAGSPRRALFADHQGSIVAVSDQYGSPLAINAYDAWGVPNASNVGRFGYTGQTWVPELGLWYYKARFYSAKLGAAAAFGAQRVVAEANIGGQMVEAVLRGAGLMLPVRLVHARVGKAARAEPVAALFEAGRAKLAGRFPALEEEMAGLTGGGGYEGASRSPDRTDAMVYALTELLIEGAGRGEPRIRRL